MRSRVFTKRRRWRARRLAEPLLLTSVKPWYSKRRRAHTPMYCYNDSFLRSSFTETTGPRSRCRHSLCQYWLVAPLPTSSRPGQEQYGYVVVMMMMLLLMLLRGPRRDLQTQRRQQICLCDDNDNNRTAPTWQPRSACCLPGIACLALLLLLLPPLLPSDGGNRSGASSRCYIFFC